MMHDDTLDDAQGSVEAEGVTVSPEAVASLRSGRTANEVLNDIIAKFKKENPGGT